jgi:uncharacterized Fe-S cluster protein YjdI
MSKKIYRGKAVDVAFDADTCIHAAECVRGMPAVFDPERKPWILPDAGDAAALAHVVALCPSGALEIVEREAEAGAGRVEVKVTDGGPYLLSGDVCVLGSDGKVLREGAKIALCRCTKSANAPFCDGSHAK